MIASQAHQTSPSAGDIGDRAAICLFLAHAFRRELRLDLVRGMARHGLLAALEQHGYRVDADKLGDDAYLKALRHEYTRIFIGPGPHVAPYGSVHHPADPKRGQLWGNTTTWVRRFIKDHGLGLGGKAYDGIPDHVGHELELYGRLLEAEHTAEVRGDGDRAARLRNSQRILLTEQLEAWVPAFCDKVVKRAELPFYAAVARLTKDLLTAERERLGA